MRPTGDKGYIWSRLNRHQVSKRGKGTDNRQYRHNGLKGRRRQYYSWDRKKNELEVFDHNGDHIGSFDSITGQRNGGPVDKRKMPENIDLGREFDETHAVV